MKTRISIEVSITRDKPEYLEALQKVAQHISMENLIQVAKQIDKHGAEALNKKLAQGLSLL